MARLDMSDVVRRARRGYVQCVTDRDFVYVQRFNTCNKIGCSRCLDPTSGKRIPKHGPYWYLIAWHPGRQREILIYIGQTLDTTKYRFTDGSIDWDGYFNRERRGKSANAPALGDGQPPIDQRASHPPDQKPPDQTDCFVSAEETHKEETTP